MQIVLIGNYPKDSQESMIRFAKMLQEGFIQNGVSCEIWLPNIFFGIFAKSTLNGLGKWLGYFDKYILFPIILRVRTFFYNSTNTIYHICDHSNAIYLPHIYSKKKGITCHDVLAIRGALGYSNSYCEASKFGKLLQKWILKNLQDTKYLAAVSELTLNQLQEITKFKNRNKWVVIHNAFNDSFSKLSNDLIQDKLSFYGLNNKSYLLHVGSALPRKNRNLLLKMSYELGDKWEGLICFAGEPLENELIELAIRLGLESRIISVVKPDHETLNVLYNGCEYFVFPSFSEGFGWPVIEAQACGVPVIASSIQPMPEISGGAAIHVSPDDPKGFEEAFLKLKNLEFREQIIKKGCENIKRFDRQLMIEKYLNLYN